jgi:hypothetical protein
MKIVLTNSAKFNPYTFDEMLKPLAMASDAYNAVQSGIEELGAKADLMKMYANEVPDSKTANMYNSYAKDLENQASMLAKHGLTPASRQGLLNMKRRYSSEVVPIETAVARREALTKEQREALLRDPSLMFDVDYSKTQLDYLLDNPNATYNPISGNELTKRAAQMAGNLAKVVQGNPKYQSILNGQYFQQMTQMGYTPTQIMQTVLNDDNAPVELRQIAETVFNDAGLSKYSQDIQDRARGFINSGLYEGIGTAKYDAMSNRGYISPAERERLDMERDRLEMAKEQQQWAKEQKEDATKGILLPNGNRLKVIGAGRAVEIAPDGTYKPVAFPSSSTTAGGVSRSAAEKKSTFTTLEYTGGSFNTPGWSDKFNVSDAELIDFGKLSPKARKKLQDDLKEYGLSVADVDIYEDHDYFTRNHYRVVRKGAGVYGIDVTTPEQQQNEGL